MRSSALGLMGLGVMGANLARNLARNGARLALFDTAVGAAAPLAKDIGDGAVGTEDIPGLIAALPAPRSIMLMVPAGQPVDDALEALRPHLNTGDIVIDGGNSFYRDTQRRQIEFARQGVHVLGFGVSGGAEGALKGPAIMAGGETAAVASVAPLFEAIAAEAPDGSPCFARVGSGAAGHFVKTVHNGIEYAHMQLIAEAWHLLRRMVGLSHDETRTIFARWAEGELSSFLMECAVQVLDTRDPESGVPMIERVVDTAEQKGTGQWTANAALAYGVAAPTLAEAVHARCLSALKGERLATETALGPSTMAFSGDRMALTAAMGRALLAANIAVLAQGFALMRAADQEEGWGIDLATVARVWQGGCIVRSTLLEPIAEACASLPAGTNLLRAPTLWRMVNAGDASWRQVVVTAIAHGVPVPAFASSLSYVDALRTGRLWADMIASQRDVFGQHGFSRLDKPGRHHADWAPYTGDDKG